MNDLSTPELTRRRLDDRTQSWGICYGDVLVGSIRARSGVPLHVDQWQWSSGMYPGLDIKDSESGTAESFEKCREQFAAAFERLKPKLTDASLKIWRNQRDFTAWKYEMWDAKCKLPTEYPSGVSKCFCGAEITIAGMPEHIDRFHAGN